MRCGFGIWDSRLLGVRLLSSEFGLGRCRVEGASQRPLLVIV